MQAEEVAPWADEHSSRSSSSEVEVMAEPALPRYEPLVMVDAQAQTDAGIRKALQACLVDVHDALANTQLRLQLGCRTSSGSFPTKNHQQNVQEYTETRPNNSVPTLSEQSTTLSSR